MKETKNIVQDNNSQSTNNQSTKTTASQTRIIKKYCPKGHKINQFLTSRSGYECNQCTAKNKHRT